MADTVLHKTLPSAPTRVSRTNWGEEHSFSGGALGSLLYRDTGATDGANWLAAAAGILACAGAGQAPAWTTALKISGSKVGVGVTSESLPALTVPSFTFHGDKTITETADADTGIPFYFHSTIDLATQDAFASTFWGVLSEVNLRGAARTGRTAAMTGLIAAQGDGQQDDVIGVMGAIENNEPGTAIVVSGKAFHAYVRAIDNNITNAYGYYVQNVTDAGRTITNSYGAYLANPSGAGAVTNNYGLYLESQTKGATLNFSLYSAGGQMFHAGDVGIGPGATDPQGPLDVRGDAYFGNPYQFRVAANFLGSGELGAGVYLGSTGDEDDDNLSLIPSSNSARAGATLAVGYHNGSAFYSAAEVSNVAGGGATRGALLMMKGGGTVGIGTSAPLAALSINGGLHVGGDSDPGDDNLTVDGVLTVNGCAVTTTQSKTKLSAPEVSVANGVSQFLGATLLGQLIVTASGDTASCQYGVGGNSVQEHYDHGGVFTATKDNASTINVFYDAAGASGAGYYLQNNRSTQNFRLMLVGV